MRTKYIIYKLLRDHEDKLGESSLTKLVCKSLKNSIDEVNTCSVKELLAQFYEFIWIINRSEPKIVQINNTLNNLLWIVKKNQHKILVTDVKFVKTFLKNEIDNRIQRITKLQDKVISHGAECIRDKDVIMIHSISSTIFGILRKAKSEKRYFKVVVAQQECTKTDLIIRKLRKFGISTEVIPEYAVNHVMDEITKIFFGAFSVTSDGHFLANIGTKAIISICKIRNTPIYVFPSSLKFSLETRALQNIHSKRELHHVQDITYHVKKYSHDFIDLANVSFIVTDDGKFPIKDLDTVYKKVKDELLFTRPFKLDNQ